MDDVPHSLKKKARTLAAVCDPVVMNYFKARGQYDGSSWACGDAEEALVCRQRVATYSDAWENAQVCLVVTAETTASRRGT